MLSWNWLSNKSSISLEYLTLYGVFKSTEFISSLNKYKFNIYVIYGLKHSENQSHIFYLFLFKQSLEERLWLEARGQRDPQNKGWLGVECWWGARIFITEVHKKTGWLDNTSPASYMDHMSQHGCKCRESLGRKCYTSQTIHNFHTEQLFPWSPLLPR